MGKGDKDQTRDHRASVRDSLLILGQEIPIEYRDIPHEQLRFYADNPRVYSILRPDESAPTQEQIEQLLSRTDHVKWLVQDIKRHRGLTDHVIVRGGTFEVLEGNSRLAAYRLLSKDPAFATMRCKVLPANIADDLVSALLGQFHITGKLAWEPFEKAGFFYRRYLANKSNSEAIAREFGVTKGDVEHLIRVFKFMLDKNDTIRDHWSYYDEYLKSRDITKARQLHDNLDDTFVELVNHDDDMQAMDVRKKLAHICNHPKALSKVLDGSSSVSREYQKLVDSGAEAQAYQKLKRFNEWFSSKGAEKELEASVGQQRARITLELKKLNKNLAKAMKAIK